MQRDEKTLWNQKYSERSHTSLEPDPFLVSAYSEWLAGSPAGTALDVAGGVGRHTLWLAERGWRVALADVSDVGIELARKNVPGAYTSGPAAPVQFETADLQTCRDLGHERYDLILVFFYLQRELFPALVSALKPGGFLFYKTYTVDQQHLPGGPSHPMHLLQPNELLRAFASLRILHYHESVKGKGVAELAAVKG
ncbi:MAG TPA: class I SAM-dependent methyltransferase [Candidatus Angelobacter sp.]